MNSKAIYPPKRSSGVRTLIALAVLALTGAAFAPAAQAQDLFSGRLNNAQKVRDVQVETTLLADTTAIESGVPFRIGVRFQIIPHWHIYWRFAGDVGIPTLIDWTLPEGFEAGDLQWPNPTRFYDDTADLTSYGWGEEVLLFATITPPADLQPGTSFTFKANNEWLACEVECVPGSSKNELTLSVGDASASPDSALFDRFAALVPGSLENAPEGLSVRIDPERASMGTEEVLEQKVFIETEGSIYLLKELDGQFASLFPDGSGDIESNHPTLQSLRSDEELEGVEAYRELEFDWNLETWGNIGPGTHRFSPALTLPVYDATSGESSVVYLALDREVKIRGDGTPVAATSSEPGTEATPPNAADADSSGFSFITEKRTEDRSMALFLLFAFIGGLFLNVMPCVLPVLSIKILGFVNQANEDPKRIFHLGLVFGLGVLVSFLALATTVVAIQSAGAQVGWGFQLQEPRFVVVMIAIIFAFGLSLFGVYSIDLPGAATQGLAGATGKEGPGGAFFNGVLATVLATPCTAPLLGPALGFAFSQPPIMIYLFFVTIALGLAAPYVLLSWKPAWLKIVPKPGPWMETFKQSMGMLMMATVVWLLWVLGKQAGADAIVATLSFLLVISIACWAIGWGFDLSATNRKRATASVVALTLTLGAYFYFPERYLDKLGGAVASAEPTTKVTGETEWKPFSIDLVNELSALNKTIFVDFTADWCLTCKVNEKTVLSTKKVQAAFAEYEVETLLADYSRRQPEITKILQQFGRAGVPMYLVFPAGHPEDYILLPEVLTTSLVVDTLAEASNLTSVASVEAE